MTNYAAWVRGRAVGTQIPFGSHVRILGLLAIGVAVGSLGCEGRAGLRTLQAGVQDAFAADRVELTRSDASLEVKLVNSPANELSEEDREDRAQEVAAFVRDHYSAYGAIQVIRVEFVQEVRVGLISGSKSTSYRFSTSDLGPKRS